MADGVDIDIYAEVEHDFQEGDYSSGGNPNNSGNGSADLYDDILTNNGGSHSGVGDFPPELNSKGNDVPTGVSSNYTGKRVALYVGNMTWWTTDQDLTNSINVLGVNDLLEIKFYENRVNGQSKGFAVVTVGSDGSSRIVMDKLPTKELHGQHPIVTHCNRQALTQFEAQARKENPQDSRNRFRNQRNQQGQGPPGPQQQQQQPLPPPPPPQFHPPGGPMRNGQRNMGPPLRLQGNMPNMPPNMHLHPGGPPMVTPLAMRGPLGPRPPMPGQHLGPRPDWGDRGHQGHHHPQHHPHQHHPHHDSLLVGPPGGLNLGPGPQMPGPPTAHSHAHVNPAFFPQPPGLRPELAFDPNRGGDPYYRPPGRPDQGHGGPPMSEQEFAEIMERNKSVSSSAIARAVQDAAAGEYASAIETLVTAISLIKQSKVANDDRCRILITSLQDTLKGIEDKSYGSRTRSRSRERSRHRSRSRDRDSRERERRHRHRSRSHERDYSRGRSRERFYEERASHHRRY